MHLRTFFSKSYTPSSSFSYKSPGYQGVNIYTVHLPEFEEVEVTAALKKIKPKMTTGPDGIPAFLLKDCAYVLAYPLKILFNLCLRNCEIPSLWKRSKVCPIFKKGDKSDISNFRPISIICNFCKALEILLHEFIYHHISNKLSVFQHGFMKGRSTTTNLICVTQFIAESFNMQSQTDIIYTDFSKAFDRLDHNLITHKLSAFGLSDSLVNLFKSYLSNRTQYVVSSGFKSVEYLATSGVPQGSILGPLLFNIFLNDIVEVIDVNCLIYADDLKIFTTVGNRNDCLRLQNNLNRLNDWCETNKLPLNAEKCNIMTFSLKTAHIIFDYNLNNVNLKRPTTFRDLGVIFDQKLTFAAHMNAIVLEANRTYGFIVRNCRDFINPDTIKLLYFTFVRSKLEYASPVWAPHHSTHINNLESVQRRFLKYLSFRSDGVYPPIGFPHQDLLAKHSVISLGNRRKYISLVFLFKLIHNITDCQELLSKLNFIVPRAASRNNSTFYLPTPRVNTLMHSPLYTACKNCNTFCEDLDIFSCSLNDLRTFSFT